MKNLISNPETYIVSGVTFLSVAGFCVHVALGFTVVGAALVLAGKGMIDIQKEGAEG